MFRGFKTFFRNQRKKRFYATDPLAIDALLMVEKPCNKLWEPACGEGHLSKRLEELGFDVRSSDLVCRNFGEYGIDFLKCNINDDDREIITNPPYRYAMEFVLKSLELLSQGHKAYFFLKVTFLEGQARYEKLFKNNPPKHVYIFSKRIICAMNGDFGKYSSSATAYAWFVWEKGYKGKTTISWIYKGVEK